MKIKFLCTSITSGGITFIDIITMMMMIIDMILIIVTILIIKVMQRWMSHFGAAALRVWEA